MNLEALNTQLDADPRKVPKVPESIKLVDEATQEIRTLSQLLHPPLLDEVGLAVAAKWLIDGFSERSGIKVNFHMTENLGRLPQNVEIALFRIHAGSAQQYSSPLGRRQSRSVRQRSPRLGDAENRRQRLGISTGAPSQGVGGQSRLA